MPFLLLTFLLTISPTTPTPFLLPLTLTHSLSLTNQTLPHLLKSSSLRSAARHLNRQFSLPLSPGSDYTLTLSLPPTSTTLSLYLDTGSDLVWFPCSPFECILCESKPPPTPIPPPPSSHLLPCSSPSCSQAHSSIPVSDLCAIARCPLADLETSSCSSSHPCPPFYYAYADGSLVARLRRGPISLSPHLRIPSFTFACAHSALAEPIGVAGFGPGPLSLPAQLASLSPPIANRFSYCLVSHSFKPHRLVRPSPLILGRAQPDQTLRPSFVFTPLLRNPKHPYFYSVGLEGISIGAARIRTRSDLSRVDRAGNGGMVVDSGTTFTMLPSRTFGEVVREFDRQMNRTGFARAVGAEGRTGLAPCYFYSEREVVGRRVPGLGLHFGGNATVGLPRRNYFMGFESEGESVGCLMVMDGGEDEGGPAGTLGNFQQQGFEVVYDLEENRVGFVRRRCSRMWEEMAHV